MDNLKLDIESGDGQLEITVGVPRHLFSPTRGTVAAMDLIVEVPSRMAVSASTGLGDTEIRGVGALQLIDALGEVRVSDVSGHVTINAGPGGLDLRNVRGSAHIEKSVGILEIVGVTGDVVIAGGHAGTSRVRDVLRDVIFIGTHSGPIEIDDVGGDLRVEKIQDGDIRHGNVRGRIEVPNSRE